MMRRWEYLVRHPAGLLQVVAAMIVVALTVVADLLYDGSPLCLGSIVIVCGFVGLLAVAGVCSGSDDGHNHD